MDFGSPSVSAPLGKVYNLTGCVFDSAMTGIWVQDAPPDAPTTGPTLILLDRIGIDTVTLGEVCGYICQQVGIPLERTDVSDIDGIPLTGLAMAKTQSARTWMQPLMDAYQVDAAEIGGKMVFRRRGGTSIRTIEQDEMVMDGKESGSVLLKEIIAEECDLPMCVVVRYRDPVKDYQPASQACYRTEEAVGLPRLTRNQTRGITRQQQTIILDLPRRCPATTPPPSPGTCCSRHGRASTPSSSRSAPSTSTSTPPT